MENYYYIIVLLVYTLTIEQNVVVLANYGKLYFINTRTHTQTFAYWVYNCMFLFIKKPCENVHKIKELIRKETTVVTTKSGSDIMFSLKLLSKKLTCIHVLHLS